VTFAQSADCGVAGHLTYGIEVLSEDSDLGSDPCGSECGLDPGMASADDNHIVVFWVAEHKVEFSPQRRGGRGGSRRFAEKDLILKLNGYGQRLNDDYRLFNVLPLRPSAPLRLGGEIQIGYEKRSTWNF